MITMLEDPELNTPQMRDAVLRFRRTSALFFEVCAPVTRAANEARKRDATAVWPWDECRIDTKPTENRP